MPLCWGPRIDQHLHGPVPASTRSKPVRVGDEGCAASASFGFPVPVSGGSTPVPAEARRPPARRLRGGVRTPRGRRRCARLSRSRASISAIAAAAAAAAAGCGCRAPGRTCARCVRRRVRYAAGGRVEREARGPGSPRRLEEPLHSSSGCASGSGAAEGTPWAPGPRPSASTHRLDDHADLPTCMP